MLWDFSPKLIRGVTYVVWLVPPYCNELVASPLLNLLLSYLEFLQISVSPSDDRFSSQVKKLRQWFFGPKERSVDFDASFCLFFLDSKISRSLGKVFYLMGNIENSRDSCSLFSVVPHQVCILSQNIRCPEDAECQMYATECVKEPCPVLPHCKTSFFIDLVSQSSPVRQPRIF